MRVDLGQVEARGVLAELVVAAPDRVRCEAAPNLPVLHRRVYQVADAAVDVLGPALALRRAHLLRISDQRLVAARGGLLGPALLRIKVRAARSNLEPCDLLVELIQTGHDLLGVAHLGLALGLTCGVVVLGQAERCFVLPFEGKPRLVAQVERVRLVEALFMFGLAFLRRARVHDLAVLIGRRAERVLEAARQSGWQEHVVDRRRVLVGGLPGADLDDAEAVAHARGLLAILAGRLYDIRLGHDYLLAFADDG